MSSFLRPPTKTNSPPLSIKEIGEKLAQSKFYNASRIKPLNKPRKMNDRVKNNIFNKVNKAGKMKMDLNSIQSES